MHALETKALISCQLNYIELRIHLDPPSVRWARFVYSFDVRVLVFLIFIACYTA
jgi:hypothetical protein